MSDPRVGFFTFIGSGKVGWMLRSQLAPGARCSLEHGGAAPVIVAPDADLDDTIPLLTKGGFYHSGQVCVSVQRVFAHASVASRVADGLARSAAPAAPGGDRAGIRSPPAARRLARADGAGSRIPAPQAAALGEAGRSGEAAGEVTAGRDARDQAAIRQAARARSGKRQKGPWRRPRAGRRSWLRRRGVAEWSR